MKCRGCGCTDDRACVYEDAGGRIFICSWVEQGLCSACAYWPPVRRLNEAEMNGLPGDAPSLEVAS